jgi:hypothetical protein
MSFTFRNLFSEEGGDTSAEFEEGAKGTAPRNAVVPSSVDGARGAKPAGNEKIEEVERTQGFLVSELLPFIPPAIAAKSGIPMEEELILPMSSDGSTDVKLSAVYQVCPQLFAAEITPLNDSTLTLPVKLEVVTGAEGSPVSLNEVTFEAKPHSFGDGSQAEKLVAKSGPETKGNEPDHAFWSLEPLDGFSSFGASVDSTSTKEKLSEGFEGVPESEIAAETQPEAEAFQSGKKEDSAFLSKQSGGDGGVPFPAVAKQGESIGETGSWGTMFDDEFTGNTSHETGLVPEGIGDILDREAGHEALGEAQKTVDDKVVSDKANQALLEEPQELEEKKTDTFGFAAAQGSAEAKSNEKDDIGGAFEAPASSIRKSSITERAPNNGYVRLKSLGPLGTSGAKGAAEAPVEWNPEPTVKPKSAALAAMEFDASGEGIDSEDTPDLEMRAIFSSSDSLSLSCVARKISELPGILGCALATPSRLVQESFSEENRFGEGAEEIIRSAKNLAKLTGLPDARSFTLQIDRCIVSLFTEGPCFLIVRHGSPKFGPGIREKLIVISRNMHKLDDR